MSAWQRSDVSLPKKPFFMARIPVKCPKHLLCWGVVPFRNSLLGPYIGPPPRLDCWGWSYNSHTDYRLRGHSCWQMVIFAYNFPPYSSTQHICENSLFLKSFKYFPLKVIAEHKEEWFNFSEQCVAWNISWFWVINAEWLLKSKHRNFRH